MPYDQDRLVVLTNAPWTTSGYGQQTALTIPRIQKLGHDVAVSGFYGLEGGCLEWNGHKCYPTDATRFGNLMLADYVRHHGGGDIHSCLAMTLMDVWVLLPGMSGYKDLRFACWTPIDHDPVPPLVARFLRESMAQPIAMSRFGQRALQEQGLDASLYVPHMVDTKVFRPQPERRDEIRAGLNLPLDAFIVGMVANNQGIPARKSFPQVFDAFADFSQRHTDALLYIHADVFGRNNGVNLLELGKAAGINPDRLRTSDQAALHLGIPAELVAGLYNAFDVLAMPSKGEGFGIPLIEAQACGVPVIATDWTAMTELCGAGWLVDGQRDYNPTQGSYQKLPYTGEILEALEEAYKHAEGMGEQAVRFAAQYDVDKVFEEFWVPTMAEVTAPREIPALRLAA